MDQTNTADDHVPRFSEGIEKLSLRRGTMYLVLEEKPSLAYQVFNHFVRQNGYDGSDGEERKGDPRPCRALVMTRQYPPDLKRSKYIEPADIYWLTTNISKESNVLSPSSITRLNYIMSEFLQGAGSGMAVIDCIEYVITQNSFETLLRMLQSWNDKIVGSRNNLLLSLDPFTLTIQQLHLIKRETLELVLP